jgi:replicative DNA helicase
MQLEVASIAASLKRLAMDLGCVVVALAQLNSGPAERKGHEPALWDIRDSRRVAQLADVVLLLHRPDRYEPASPDAGTAEVRVVKNRAGPTGTARLAWLSSVPCFADYAPEPAF